MKCVRCISYFRQLRSAAFKEYVELGEEILRSQDEELPYKAKEIHEKITGRLIISMLEKKSDDQKLEFLSGIFPNTRISRDIDDSILFSIDDCQLKKSFEGIGIGRKEQQEIAPCFCFELALLQGCFPAAKIVELKNAMLDGSHTCTWKITGLDSSIIYEQRNVCPLKPDEKCPTHTYSRLAARYFLDFIELLKSRKDIPDRERLNEKLYKIRYVSAEKGGKDLSLLSEDKGLSDLVKYYWSKFPTVEIEELSERRLVCRANSCAFKQGFTDMGASPDEIKKFSGLGCICDEAAIKGFNPKIQFRQNTNLMSGDEYCQWILTLDDNSSSSEEEMKGSRGKDE